MRDPVGLTSPAVEVVEKAPQDLAGTRLQFLGLDQRAGGARQGKMGAPAIVVQDRERRVAEAALGLVVDALEGEVVVGLGDAAQIGERVADFRPLVEPRAADDLVRQAERDEPLLEFAHLKRGAHEDRDLVERNALVLGGLDLLADEPRLLLGCPTPR